MSQPDSLAKVVSSFDAVLREGSDPGSPETEMHLQAVAYGLAVDAGLDLEQASTLTRTFLENFPSASLPFGDVDQRAARWLAQALDGPARAALRERIRELAASCRDAEPAAAAQLEVWTAGPPPPDPTEDRPWVLALVALARSQL